MAYISMRKIRGRLTELLETNVFTYSNNFKGEDFIQYNENIKIYYKPSKTGYLYYLETKLGNN